VLEVLDLPPKGAVFPCKFWMEYLHDIFNGVFTCNFVLSVSM